MMDGDTATEYLQGLVDVVLRFGGRFRLRLLGLAIGDVGSDSERGGIEREYREPYITESEASHPRL